MADRTTLDTDADMAAKVAYADLEKAVERYLAAIGFTDVVIGPGSTRSFHPYDLHEFFLQFTATRPTAPASGKEKR